MKFRLHSGYPRKFDGSILINDVFYGVWTNQLIITIDVSDGLDVSEMFGIYQ